MDKIIDLNSIAFEDISSALERTTTVDIIMIRIGCLESGGFV